MEKKSKFASINPVNNAHIKSFDIPSSSELSEKIATSFKAFQLHRSRTFAERAAIVTRLAELIDARANSIAQMIALEMGKPLSLSMAEVKKAAEHCRYYATNAQEMVKPQTIESSMGPVTVVYQPLGPILRIMPWNFPIWLPIKGAIPSLMLGNTILLKPSHTTPQCGIVLETLMKDAGFSQGEFQTVLLDVPQIEEVIADPRVAGVALTGSTKAGKSTANIAGKYMKKCVLELGGSDPFIVMEGADLKQAAALGARSRILNTGQACNAAKRFIIDQKVYDEFVRLLIEEIKNSYVIGDPMDSKVNVGPMARPDLLDNYKAQVKKTIEMGAKLIHGDKDAINEKTDPEKGNFAYPVVLENVPKDSPGAKEEVFGPAFMLFKYKDEAEAIQMANDSAFGLDAIIVTQDMKKAQEMAMKVEAGSIYVNTKADSDSRVPFGGIKDSGYGRECGEEGIKEFCNIKPIFGLGK